MKNVECRIGREDSSHIEKPIIIELGMTSGKETSTS